MELKVGLIMHIQLMVNDMKNILYSRYLLIFSQIFVSIIFIYSGIEKISDQKNFLMAIENYKVFPVFIQNIIVITFPWIEIVLGVLLMFGFYRREIALVFSALLFFFIILIFISVLRGLDIECGCFGTLSNVKVGYFKIYENFILLLFSMHLLFFSESKKTAG